MIRPHAAVQRM